MKISCYTLIFLVYILSFSQSDTFLYYRITPCFGACPAFYFTILKNYQLIWYGQKSIEKIGRWEKKLTKHEIKQLNKILRQVSRSLNNIDTLCIQNVTDISSVIFKFQGKKYYYHCLNSSNLTNALKPLVDWVLSLNLKQISYEDNY